MKKELPQLRFEWSILSRYGNDPSLTLDPFERLLALRSAFGFPCFALSICCDSNLSSLSFNSLTIEGRVVHSLSRSASAALSQCTRTSREGEGERLDACARHRKEAQVLERSLNFLFVSSGRAK